MEDHHTIADLLSTPQRRAVAVTLQLLDRRLTRFAALATTTNADSPLVHVRNTLSLEQRRRIVSECTAIREILAQLRDDLRLPVHTIDVGQRIGAGVATLSIALTDLESKRIHRFGVVEPEVASALDRLTHDLLTRLERLTNAAGWSQNDTDLAGRTPPDGY